MQNITAEDGKEVTLSCTVTGTPAPEITWTHNNKSIDKSEDFVITYDRTTGKIDLVIVDCLPDDQGLFRCIAKNPMGQAVTQCTLTLRGAPPTQVAQVSTSVEALPPKSPKVHHTDVIVNVGTEIENVESQLITERLDTVTQHIVKRSSAQPPKFSTPIHPCVVKEGESCIFSAVVSGAPQPEVIWLKDKVPLVPNDHYVTEHDKATNLCTLTINVATSEDIAVYSCQATNIAGKATCTANVVVVPMSAEVMITDKTVSVKKEKVTVIGEMETRTTECSPTFTQGLMPFVDATEGDTVRFQCAIDAEPVPFLTWYHKGQELFSSGRVTVDLEKQTTSVTIKDVTPDDAGEYLCRAKNPLGESSVKTVLRVRRKDISFVPVPATTPGEKLVDGYKDEPMDITFSTEPQQQGLNVPQPQAPAPSPLTEPCAVISSEPYYVHKSFVEVSHNPMHTEERRLISLYKKTYEQEEEAPKFMLPLRNQTVNDGDEAILRVMFRGNPSPTITWYFNSQPIIPNRDFQINVDLQRGESTLMIVEVFPEDEGEFMCKAENHLGTAVTHCHLFVKIPTSSEEEGTEKIVSKTVQTFKTVEPVKVKEVRRFSETISIEHQQRLKEMQLLLNIPKKKKERVEKLLKQEAALRGMKMEVTLPGIHISEKKLGELKKRVQALSTQRQTLEVPIAQQRRFSETIAVDMSRRLQALKKVEKSQVHMKQSALLKGMKLEVEYAEQKKLSSKTVPQVKKVEAVGTERQELNLQLGQPPRFVIDIQPLKVMDGDEAKFVCLVTGSPMPQSVQWFHNKKEITENQDFHMFYNPSTGQCMLHIVEVFPQDSGLYECMATNPYGKASTTTQLVVDVYEYVADSEEATASQTESIISTSSMDEAEFQMKTQRFLEHMEKLRREIQDEVTKEMKEEVVEEMEVVERSYEETIQMADVKWQVPKRASTLEERVMPEDTQGLMTPLSEQTKHSEIVLDILKATVKGRNPTRVHPQFSGDVNEMAPDLFAEGAHEISHTELKTELRQPSIDWRKETRVQPVSTHFQSEFTELTNGEIKSEMQTQKQEIVIELAHHLIQRHETRVDTMLQKQPHESTDELYATGIDASKQEEVQLQLDRPTIIGKTASRVLGMFENLQPEQMMEGVQAPLVEQPEGKEMPAELLATPFTSRLAARVLPTAEENQPEGVDETFAPGASSTEHKDVHVELSKPAVEKMPTRVESIIELQPEEQTGDETYVPGTSTSKQEDVQVELLKPDVKKMPTRVESVMELQLEEQTGDETYAPGTSISQQEDVQVELSKPAVEKMSTRVESIVELQPEEQTGDVAIDEVDFSQQKEVSVELEQPAVSEKPYEPEEVYEELILPDESDEVRAPKNNEEKPSEPEEFFDDIIEPDDSDEVFAPKEEPFEEVFIEMTEVLIDREMRAVKTLQAKVSEVEPVEHEETDTVALPASELTHEEEIAIELSKGISKPKQAMRVEAIRDEIKPEEITDVAVPITEETKQEEIQIPLAKQQAKTKQSTRVEAVHEQHIIHEANDVVATGTDMTEHEEFKVDLSHSNVSIPITTRVDVIGEENHPEETEMVILPDLGEMKEEEVRIELAKQQAKMKLPTRVEAVGEDNKPEETETVSLPVREETKQEEISVDLVKQQAKMTLPTRVEAVGEDNKPEETETVSLLISEETKQEEVNVDLVEQQAKMKLPTRVEAVGEDNKPEETETVSLPVSEETKQEEVNVDLVKQQSKMALPTRVEAVDEDNKPEETETVALPVSEETKQEEVNVDLVKQQAKVKQSTRVETVVEEHKIHEAHDVVATGTESMLHEEISVELSQPESKTRLATHVDAVREEHVPEETELVSVPIPEDSNKEDIVITLDKQQKKSKQSTRVETVVEEHKIDQTLEVMAPSSESTHHEEIHVEFTQPQIPTSLITRVEAVGEENLPEETYEVSPEKSEQTKEEEMLVELATQNSKIKQSSRVEIVAEEHAIDEANEIVATGSEITQHKEIIIELAEPAQQKRQESNVESVEEHRAPEEASEVICAETEQSHHEEIVFVLDKSQSVPRFETRVTTVNEENVPEGIHEIKTEPQDVSNEAEIAASMLLPVQPVKQETLTRTLEEKLPVEVFEVLPHVESEQSKGNEIEQIQLDISEKQHAMESNVQEQEDSMSIHSAGSVRSLSPEKTTEENIVVDLAKSNILSSQLSRVQAQIAKVSAELTEEYQGQVSTAKMTGEEIIVELAQQISKKPIATHAMQQEQKPIVEISEDMAENIPAMQNTKEEEVVLELIKSEREKPEESHVEHIEEVLSEGAAEESMDQVDLDMTVGEEVHYPMALSATGQKEASLVGLQEEQQPVEREEELFFEIPEPGVNEQNVPIDTVAAEVQPQLQSLVGMQVECTNEEVAHEEELGFSEEKTSEEKINAPLQAACKYTPFPQRVGIQEGVNQLQSTSEIIPQDVCREISRESEIESETIMAASKPADLSLVGLLEERNEMHSTREDVTEFTEEATTMEEITVDMVDAGRRDRPVTRVEPLLEGVRPEMVAEEYVNSIKEAYMIPSLVRPEYEPSAVELYRFETRARAQVSSQNDEIQTGRVEEIAITEQISGLQIARTQSIMSTLMTEEQRIITEEVTEKYTTEISRSVTQTERSVTTVTLIAPVFEIPLSDVTVVDGERAILECVVSGHPVPVVSWYADGQEIKQSADFRISMVNGICTLEINGVLPEDEGEYTVKAVNDAGTCITTAYLTILRKCGVYYCWFNMCILSV